MDTIGMSAEGNVSVMLGDPRRAIRTMAVPILIALVVTEVNSLADRSWCSGLGADALAAVALCSPLYFVITGLGTGMGVGGAATVSRLIGSGDRDRAASAAYQTLLFSLVFGLVLTLPLVMLCEDILVLIGSGDVTGISCDYMVWIMVGTPVFVMNGAVAGLLRGEGAAKVSTMMMAVTAIVNIVLDPVLIYVLDMGVAGAAWATVVAFVVSCVIASYWYLRGKGMYISIRRSDYRPDMRICRGIMSVGGPEALELSIMYLFNIFLNYMVIECGGTDMVGLYSTGWRVANFILIIAQSMGGAMVAVCAAEYGMKRFDMIRDAFAYSVRTSVIWTLALSVVLAIGAGALSTVFTISDDLAYLHDDMTQMFYFFAVFLPVMSLVYTGSSLMQSIDKATGGMVNSLARNIIMSLAFLVATVSFGTLTSLWWAMALSEILGGVMMGVHAVIVLRRTEAREGGPATVS